jgi:hypothetical protein
MGTLGAVIDKLDPSDSVAGASVWGRRQLQTDVIRDASLLQLSSKTGIGIAEVVNVEQNLFASE